MSIIVDSKMDPFMHRVESYMYAVERYPHCMGEEFESMVEELRFPGTEVPIHLLNLDGVASPLFWWFPKNANIEYVVMESSPSFAEYAKVPLYLPSKIPIQDGTMDRVCVNASLHHMTRSDRCKLYKEIFRILRSNSQSQFVLGDVMEGSKEDRWLNGVVDRYNPNGHKGIFFQPIQDGEDMRAQGFEVESKIKRLRWRFRSEGEMVDFMMNLFGMRVAFEGDPGKLIELVDQNLGLDRREDGSLEFEWELIYFIGTKSDRI